MNIRDIKTYAAYLLLLGVLYALTSCQRKNDPVPKPVQQRPIELSAATEWPDSKGIIDNVTDLAGDGIVVWAAWSQDLGGGITKNDSNVFGENGTKVYFPNWTYRPTCYWTASTYNFAAALPASVFNATHGHDGNPETDRLVTGTFDGNDLSLIFDNFDLSGSQTDLIYTFQTVDNTGSQNPIVSLNFQERLCTQLRIEMTSEIADDKTFSVNEVSVYGLHKSLDGEIHIDSEGLKEEYLRIRLSDRSDYDSPYTIVTKPAEADWTISSGRTTELINELIVFPEAFSETSPMYIKIVYDDNHELIYTLNNGEWEAGRIYTYLLKPESITIGDPVVKPWGTIKLPEFEIK